MKLTINSNVDIIGNKRQPELLPGELWNVSTGPEGNRVPNNSFIAFTLMSYPRGGTGGQNNWLRLKQPEIELVMRVNGISSRLDRKMLWLVADIGTIYLTENGEDEKNFTTLRWPRIAIGSRDAQNRNVLRVIGTSGEYKRIQGIPHSSDYSKYTVADYPEYFARIWCTTVNGQVTEVPNLGTMWMPIFDPSTGYEISAGGTGLWIHYSLLHGRVGL